MTATEESLAKISLAITVCHRRLNLAPTCQESEIAEKLETKVMLLLSAAKII